MSDFELYIPPIPPDLAAMVAAWAGYRECAAPCFTRIEYPDGRAQLIFEFGDAIGVGRPGVAGVRHCFGFFAGIDDLPSATHVGGVQAGVQVTLTTRGALALTGGDLAAFARQVVPAEDIGFARSLCDQLHAAADWPARFTAVASALRTLLRAGGDRAPLPSCGRVAGRTSRRLPLARAMRTRRISTARCDCSPAARRRRGPSPWVRPWPSPWHRAERQPHALAGVRCVTAHRHSPSTRW